MVVSTSVGADMTNPKAYHREVSLLPGSKGAASGGAWLGGLQGSLYVPAWLWVTMPCWHTRVWEWSGLCAGTHLRESAHALLN